MRHLITPTRDSFNSKPSDEIVFEAKFGEKRYPDEIKIEIPGNGQAGTRFLTFDAEEFRRLVAALGVA